MKFYNDKNTTTLVQTVASANTFVSSITGIIKNQILKAFPKGYFKHIYTDTAEAFQDYNKTDLNNKTAHKIPYPNLTISPAITTESPISGMEKNILVSSPNMWVPRTADRYFPKILENPDLTYRMYFSSDYITTNIRFTIVVDSFVQAMNIGYFLKSRFDDQTFKYLDNQMIRVEIPKSYINIIAKAENLFTTEDDAITNEADMTALEKLLLQIGRRDGKITREKSLNNGSQGFYFTEKENILTLFTDLDIPETVIRDNSINGEYNITFRVQASAWHPNAFIFVLDNNLYRTKVQTDTMLVSSLNQASETGETFYSTSIAEPIVLDRKDTINFSYINSNNEQVNEIGQNIIHETFNFSSNNEITHLNIASLLKAQLLKIHSYAKEHNYELKELLYIVARSYTSAYPEVGTVDYKNLCIDFDSPIDSNIVLDVFVNKAMCDVIVAAMNNDSFYRSPNAFTTINLFVNNSADTTTTTLSPVKARVYMFRNTKEMESTDLNKCLRVNTMYGVGYIGLVMEGAANASPYKVCVGQNSFGSIIRCLELA